MLKGRWHLFVRVRVCLSGCISSCQNSNRKNFDIDQPELTWHCMYTTIETTSRYWHLFWFRLKVFLTRNIVGGVSYDVKIRLLRFCFPCEIRRYNMHFSWATYLSTTSHIRCVRTFLFFFPLLCPLLLFSIYLMCIHKYCTCEKRIFGVMVMVFANKMYNEKNCI